MRVTEKFAKVLLNTVEQVNTFVDHVAECDEPYGSKFATLCRIAARCGLRRGEVVGLAWPDVDLDAGTITIEQTIQVDRGSLYVKGPKSDNGYRTIGLDRDTANDLVVTEYGCSKNVPPQG